MTIKYPHDTDTFTTQGLCNRVIFEIEIEAGRYEDEAEYFIESIWDETAGCARELTDFDEAEQGKLERLFQEMADERAHELWMDRETMRIDAAYDAWKHGDFE